MAERDVVTGAAGFLGSHLVRTLLADGRDVVAVVGAETDLWRLADVLDEIELTRADVRRLEPSQIAPPVGCVYHLAAAGVTATVDAVELAETNVVGTARVIASALGCGAQRLVYCGSCFEYGPGEGHAEDAPLEPISEYGASKASGSLLARAAGRRTGLPVVSVRPFTVYGPYEAPDRLVPAVVLSSLRGGPVNLTAGTQTRDFVWVDDAVEGLLAAARSRTAVGGVFNLCTGIATPVAELAERAVELCGADVEIRLGAAPGRLVEFQTLSGDPRRAATVLGWQAETELEDGLRQTIDWFRSKGERLAPYLPGVAVT